MKVKKTAITCEACKKDRLISTNGMLKASYEKTHPRCHRCGYNKILSGKTTFKKNDPRLMGNEYRVGHVAWNRGIKGTHFSVRTEFKKGVIRDEEEKTPNWKGDRVGYVGLHAWIYRKQGKARKCAICAEKRPRHVHWANISHKYKRDLNDFIQLCALHHFAYDKGRISL